MSEFDVFISYSSQDAAVADAALAALEASSIRCWMAPRNIHPGEEWASAIPRAMTKCKAMVLLFTANANNSPQVRREVDQAVKHGLTIFTVRLGDVKPHEALAYFLDSLHWFDATSAPIDQHVEKLSHQIKGYLNAANGAPIADAAPLVTPGPPAFTAPAKVVEPPKKSPVLLWGGIAAALVVVAGGAAVFLLSGHQTSTPRVAANATQPAPQPPSAAASPPSGDYAQCATASTAMAHDAAQSVVAACGRILDNAATGSGAMPPSRAYLGQGIANIALGDNADALTELGQSISMDGGDEHAYYVRALAENDLQNYPAAYNDAIKALSITPNDWQAMTAKASSEFGQLDYQAAADDAGSAIQTKPNYLPGYFVRGEALAKLGQDQEAVQDETTVLQAHPYAWDALYWRGFAEARLNGAQPQAINDLQASLQNNGDNADAYHQLALIAFRQQNWQGAVDAETRALSINPSDAASLTTRAGAEIHLGQFAAARTDAEEAVRLNPTGPLLVAAYENLGISEDDQNDYADGVGALQQAAQLMPDNQDLAGLLAAARQHLSN
jgi:tetratricopeptide (TPR) repeat protein